MAWWGSAALAERFQTGFGAAAAALAFPALAGAVAEVVARVAAEKVYPTERARPPGNQWEQPPALQRRPRRLEARQRVQRRKIDERAALAYAGCEACEESSKNESFPCRANLP